MQSIISQTFFTLLQESIKCKSRLSISVDKSVGAQQHSILLACGIRFQLKLQGFLTLQLINSLFISISSSYAGNTEVKMLERIVEFFFSKVGEQLVDYAQNNGRSIKEFKSTLDSLQRNFNSLSAKASDVEEQIKNAELSGKKKRKREVENWLKEVQIIETEFLKLENEAQSEGFISRFLGGDRAQNLNQRVDELIEQSRHFGELLLNVYETRGEALLTTRLVGEAFEKNLERIWKFLVTDKVSSIGIYGMGGVGKTTLTRHVHNQLLEKTQECVFWVTISQEFSVMMLQDKIAHVLGLDLSDEYDEDKRAARLNRALSLRKNIVLILDDVWKNIRLDKVGDPLRVEGCRLIITTRSLEVCRQIGCQEIIEVKTLDRDEAWDLFVETLGQDTSLAPQLQEIAKSLAKECGGLPLGIITIAGSMRGVTSIHVWRNALAELKESVIGQDVEEDVVFKVLKYSFDRLDQGERKSNGYTKLQLCFLYCSLYPEDYSIPREELVNKFISEELVDKRKSLKAQLDQSHSILDKLMNVCLLESTLDLEHRECVKMHDLVRAMALKITEGKTMVIAGHYSLKEIPNEEEWTKDLEKMSLMCNSIEEIPPRISPNCPKLSTLLFHRNPLEFIPNSFFSQMHGLCTLDLSGTAIMELPNSLCDLESLKALLLGGCKKLEYVPYMRKLKALRELDLSGTAIKKVPQGMETLFNLTCLSMNGANYLKMLPTGLLLNFQYLQRLRLPYQIQTPVEEIEVLKQLEEFQGRVKDVCDFNRFIIHRRSKLHTISYCILLGEGRYYFEETTPDMDCNKVILDARDLNKREEKDVIMLAQDIQQLEFQQCEGLSNCLLDDFPRLNNPTSLKTLGISSCEGIECILKNEQLIAPQELQSRFQTVEAIKLYDLPDFMSVIHKREIGPPPPQVVFSSLKRLFISHCNKMKKLGLPLSEFQNLEKIFIHECDEIEEIIAAANDDGRGEARVISLPKLKYLRLIQLPRLESICKATMICSSLKIIDLRGCRALKKLPLYFPPCTTLHGQPSCYSTPRALKEIWIDKDEEERWESFEWEHPTHYHLLQPFLRFWDYSR
ncbi:hypothetical protein Pfo_020503 [Paulownia fortunei]|nr:hypothetical protein Pfo_020503 [Paulownia fortunei]